MGEEGNGRFSAVSMEDYLETIEIEGLECGDETGEEKERGNGCVGGMQVARITKGNDHLIVCSLLKNGWKITQGDNWLLLWTNSNKNPIIRSIHRDSSLFDRHGAKGVRFINHFLGSGELTRKDRLFKYVNRFNSPDSFIWMSESYVLPKDWQEANRAIKEAGSDVCWIKKPPNKAQGRGIFIHRGGDFKSNNGSKELNRTKEFVFCRYIDNPLTVKGFKFDLRLYVCVTSYLPLVVYFYKEGLCRFASEKYRSPLSTLNRFVHLTNYSVNKLNSKYLRAPENFTLKWKLSELLLHLEKEHSLDSFEILGKLQHLVIHSLKAVRFGVIEKKKRMTTPRTKLTHQEEDQTSDGELKQVVNGGLNNGVCDRQQIQPFEMYGFDVMFDDTLRPWLLEVNSSPSLTCDCLRDHSLKSKLIADLFNLVLNQDGSCLPGHSSCSQSPVKHCGGWELIFSEDDSKSLS